MLLCTAKGTMLVNIYLFKMKKCRVLCSKCTFVHFFNFMKLCYMHARVRKKQLNKKL